MNPDSAPQVGGEPQTKPVEYVGRAFNVVGFRAYATQLRFATWKPELIVLHSTVSPNLAQWHQRTGEKSMQGFADIFGEKGWSAGPHLFIDDERIWVFSPLEKPGIHAGKWNKISIGISMV
jgi:hypothetical protein